MDVVKYVEQLDQSRLSDHQQQLLRKADYELEGVRRKALYITMPISAALFFTSKHKPLLQRLSISFALPVVGILLAQAYGLNRWLAKRYLITKSQQDQLQKK